MATITNRTYPPFILTHKTDVVITRHLNSEGEYVNGKWISGSTEDIVVEANVQPAQFKEIMQMPESDRTKEWIKLYTVSLLRTDNEGIDGWEADIVNWDGFKYKVMKCRRYSMGVLDHYHVMAARVPVSAL